MLRKWFEDGFALFFGIIVVLIISGFMRCQTPAEASNRLIPWTPRTHLILGHCMIAEADESAEDHIAIAYAARNLWKVRQRRWPNMRYEDLLLSYCSVHKLSVKSLSKRQRWIRELGFPKLDESGIPFFEKPENFPRKASWDRKRRIWREILRRAHDWHLGKYKDPCRGRAVHWGAPQDENSRWYLPSDEPSEKLARLPCSDRLENDFYRYKTSSELGN